MPAVPQTQSYPTSAPHFLAPLTLTHHSHLPEKSWQCLPNPAQSVISKKPNINQQGPPPLRSTRSPLQRVVQYIDQLIADPTPIFRCPHLHVEAHNTMNKDCTQTCQDLSSLVEKQRAHRTSPEFFKKYNITPRVDNVRTNKSQEDELAEFAVLVEVGEVPSVAWTYLPWAPEEVRNAWPDYCHPWFWQRHHCVGLNKYMKEQRAIIMRVAKETSEAGMESSEEWEDCEAGSNEGAVTGAKSAGGGGEGSGYSEYEGSGC